MVRICDEADNTGQGIYIHRDQKVCGLEEELRNMEETSSCEKCSSIVSSEITLKEHENIIHSDENLPSTSKCGKCDYNSDDEDTLKEHIQSEHVIVCDLCDFRTESKAESETHMLFEHNNACPECSQTYKTYEKLEKHTCKLEVNNPTFGSYYTKSWVDGNGCNTVYCDKVGEEFAILHCEKCVMGKKSCCWAPYNLSSNCKGILHLELNTYTKEGKIGTKDILWPSLTNNMN